MGGGGLRERLVTKEQLSRYGTKSDWARRREQLERNLLGQVEGRGLSDISLCDECGREYLQLVYFQWKWGDHLRPGHQFD